MDPRRRNFLWTSLSSFCGATFALLFTGGQQECIPQESRISVFEATARYLFELYKKAGSSYIPIVGTSAYEGLCGQKVSLLTLPTETVQSSDLVFEINGQQFSEGVDATTLQVVCYVDLIRWKDLRSGGTLLEFIAPGAPTCG